MYLLALVVATFLPAVARAGAQEREVPKIGTPARIVAIGDVHGDFRTFSRLLAGARLIDATMRWSGERTVLVQTGDLLDRGAGSRRVMDLLMALEKEAEAAGGRVVVLLGNHEVLNLVGDLRYVGKGEFRSYAVDGDPVRRRRQLESIKAFLRAPTPLLRSDYYADLRDDYSLHGIEKYYPPGYFGHRSLFAPSGTYGKWLLRHGIIARVGRSLFVHGGLGPRFASIPFRELGERFGGDLEDYFDLVKELVRLQVFHPAFGIGILRDLLDAEARQGTVHPRLAPLFDRFRALEKGPVFAADGPVWYRGLAEKSGATVRRQVRELLAAQDVDRIVVGHTRPLDSHVRSRFDGGVILIDTGMNQEVYGGHPEALELLGGGERLRVIGLPGQ